MADTSGDREETRVDAAQTRSVPWHDERPAYIDDEECRLALEELLAEAGVAPSMLRSRARRS
jgi:hypothetical protein